MANQITYRVNVEDSKAINSFLRMSQAERDIEIKTRKASLALKKQGAQAKKTGISFKGMIGAGIGIGSVTALITKGVAALGEYEQGLLNIAKQSNQVSDEIKSFLSILPGTKAGEKFGFELLMQAATVSGIKAGAASQIAEPIISQLNVGDLSVIDDQERAAIEKQFTAAVKGSFAKIPPELAGLLETMGAQFGLGGGVPTGLTLGAAGQSKFSKEDFAKLIPSLVQFDTLIEGLAASAALSQVFDPGRAPTLIRSASRMLGPLGDLEEFMQSRGLGDASTTERVRALSAIALSEGDQELSPKKRITQFLSKELAEAGQSKQIIESVPAIIANYETFNQVLESLKILDPIAETERVVADILKKPGQRAALQTDITAAVADIGAVKGPSAKSAQIRSLAVQETGQRLEAIGLGGLRTDTGEATTTGKMVASALDAMTSAMFQMFGLFLGEENREAFQRAGDVQFARSLQNAPIIGATGLFDPKSLEQQLERNANSTDALTQAIDATNTEIETVGAINTEINTEADE